MPDGMKLPSGVFYMGPGFVCVGKDAMAGSLPHDGSKFMLLTFGSAGGESARILPPLAQWKIFSMSASGMAFSADMEAPGVYFNRI